MSIDWTTIIATALESLIPLSEEMKLAINALYGSLDAWIDANREAMVWQAKQDKKTA